MGSRSEKRTQRLSTLVVSDSLDSMVQISGQKKTPWFEDHGVRHLR